MGRRGRLGGLAGRRDRASDRRREMADLTYDGSAPSACALLSPFTHPDLVYQIRIQSTSISRPWGLRVSMLEFPWGIRRVGKE